MHREEGKTLILDSVEISRADIAAAKAYLVDATEQQTERLVNGWLEANGAGYTGPVMIEGEGAHDNLRRVARTLSLKIAACYALWELIGSGHLMPAGEIREETGSRVAWKTARSGASWDFPELAYCYPARIYRPIGSATRGTFTDGDLYLREIGLKDLRPGIEEALREAVRCFRYDLFTGTVAMLGAALEGVWIELGMALVAVKPGESKLKKIQRELDIRARGISSLVKAIDQACEDRAQTGDILKAAEVTLQDVRAAVLWWDTVRESRNVLHWGAAPALANTFDKVSMLMLSTATHLRTLWKLRNAALEIAQST